jgi:hypothetical protein
VSKPTPESPGEIGAFTALAIVVGGLILFVLVIGIFVYLTLINPAVF